MLSEEAIEESFELLDVLSEFPILLLGIKLDGRFADWVTWLFLY
jgi:hypothetical protein